SNDVPWTYLVFVANSNPVSCVAFFDVAFRTAVAPCALLFTPTAHVLGWQIWFFGFTWTTILRHSGQFFRNFIGCHLLFLDLVGHQIPVDRQLFVFRLSRHGLGDVLRERCTTGSIDLVQGW